MTPVATTGVPVEILTSTCAVVWRFEYRDGRRTKVPYCPENPTRRAAVDDPATWAPFALACAVVNAGHADGPGVVLGDGLVGVDLDHVRDPATGALSADAQRIVQALDSYTEASPSGDGVHVLCRGTLPPGRRRRGPVELYDHGRYFTVTGQHVPGTPRAIHERTAALAALHAALFPATAPPPARSVPRAPLLDDDAALVRRATAARNGRKFAALWRGEATGYRSQSEADQALANILAFWTRQDAARIDRLFRQSGLFRDKWDSRRGALTYGERTIATAIGCGGL